MTTSNEPTSSPSLIEKVNAIVDEQTRLELLKNAYQVYYRFLQDEALREHFTQLTPHEEYSQSKIEELLAQAYHMYWIAQPSETLDNIVQYCEENLAPMLNFKVWKDVIKLQISVSDANSMAFSQFVEHEKIVDKRWKKEGRALAGVYRFFQNINVFFLSREKLTVRAEE